MKGFTLIEMLVVLFIIGLIFAVAIPKFTSGYQIKILKMASQMVAQVLQLAQQYAISCRSDVYIVFPSGTSIEELNLKSLKVFNPVTNRSITDWKILPKGVSISSDSAFIGNTIDVPFPEDNSTSSAQVYFIKFKAGVGTISGGNTSVKLILVSNSSIFQRVFCYNTTREIRIGEMKE